MADRRFYPPRDDDPRDGLPIKNEDEAFRKAFGPESEGPGVFGAIFLSIFVLVVIVPGFIWLGKIMWGLALG